MTKRIQVFVRVSEEEKEAVRELAYKLRMSESDLVKAVAIPELRKLLAVVGQDQDKAKKIRVALLKRLS